MVDKCLHDVGVTSLSVFEGNFVLAKVHWGLISVRCSELRCVCFSEVQNVLVLWKNQSGASELSAVQRLSAFQRVCYWRFYCTSFFDCRSLGT